MIYRELEPPPGSAPWVHAAWSLEMPATAQDVVLGQILPDSDLEIVCVHGSPVRYAKSPDLPATDVLPYLVVVGPPATAWWLVQEPGTRMTGVRLRAEAAALLGDPACLANTIRPVEEVCPELADTAPDALAERVVSLVHSRARPDGLAIVMRAVDVMRAHRGAIAVTKVADEVGLSVRQLQRVFPAIVGVSPKVMNRMVRFACLSDAVMRTRPEGWAMVAAEFGFFDQAHMVREFRELTGATPSVIYPPEWYEAHDVSQLPPRLPQPRA